MRSTPNAFTRPKYIDCSAKHICDRTEIWIRRNIIFLKAFKVAREQNAKSLELRVCLSMCDLYDLTQNADKCRSQLGEIYGSFSEGFDTADLLRATVRLKAG